MKKTSLYILAAILLCGIAASCSEDNDNGTSTVNKTVFVFDPYADNLTTNSQHLLLMDINEIKSSIKTNGDMNGYRVLVYYGTSSFSAVLYEIKLQDGSIVNDTLKTFSNVTQSDLQHLTTVFGLVKTLAPAKTYSLIIGGHGSGWTPADVCWSDLPSSKTASIRKKSFGAYQTQRDRIEPSTLGTAMTASSFHPDLTFFDCCYMDNIETLYDIHSSTDYIIASAGEQPGTGMPYDQIWNGIISSMNRDNVKDIMASTLAYYDKDNTGYNAENSSSVNPLSLAAIDCSEIDNVAAAMANLNKKYGDCTTDLSTLVQRFDKKTVGCFFDLLDYARYQAGNNDNDIYYKAVESAVNSAVITTACKDYYLVIFDQHSPNCWPAKTFCGITCSDPSTNSYLVEKKKLTNWWKATH